MNNKDIDAQFLCKDCERYNLCEYYHRRRKDSYICKYFHLSVTPQEPILDKIFCIVHPLSIMSTPELEHKAIMQITEMLEPLCLPESEET